MNPMGLVFLCRASKGPWSGRIWTRRVSARSTRPLFSSATEEASSKSPLYVLTQSTKETLKTPPHKLKRDRRNVPPPLHPPPFVISVCRGHTASQKCTWISRSGWRIHIHHLRSVMRRDCLCVLFLSEPLCSWLE